VLLFLATLACGDPQDRVYAPSQVPADDDYTLLDEDSVPDDLPDFRLEPISVPTWRFADTGDLLDSSVYYELTDGFTTERLSTLGAPA
jgi:hypothetical protein